MATEIQLDIFEEAKKDEIAQKIKAEDESYEKQRKSLVSQIDSLEESIRSDDDWLGSTEDRNELNQLRNDLRYLEESHKKIISELSEKQK